MCRKLVTVVVFALMAALAPGSPANAAKIIL
jgi:hypothetical protein